MFSSAVLYRIFSDGDSEEETLPAIEHIEAPEVRRLYPKDSINLLKLLRLCSPFKRKTASDTSTSPELTEEETKGERSLSFTPDVPAFCRLHVAHLRSIGERKRGEKQAKGFNTEVPTRQQPN